LVWTLFYNEGSKDMRLAIGRPHGYRSTALKVFTATNMHIVKREIEKAFPAIKKAGEGHFKHYPKYKSKCFNALTKDEKGVYATLAAQWNEDGPSPEVKAKYSPRDQQVFACADLSVRNARRNLARYMKRVQFDYGVIITCGTPGTDSKPKVWDYLRELNFSTERLAEYIDWSPVLVRVEEFTTKSYTAFLANKAVEPPAPAVPRDALPLKKKLRPSDPSGVTFTIDTDNHRVRLPQSEYAANPEFFMQREGPLYTQCMRMAFQLATNREGKVMIPWKDIQRDPHHFLPDELILDGVVFNDPSHTAAAHHIKCVDLWLSTGYIYVKNVKMGRETIAALEGTADPAGPADALSVIPSIVVNRYGSCGQEVLLATGITLYDDGIEDVIGSEVMGDMLIDPAELQRGEDEEHSHLAPCTVPETSEARAQYILTALQLVKPGKDRNLAVQCVQELVIMAWNPRDASTDEQIEASCGDQYIAPDAISWDADSPLLRDDDALAVRMWLGSRPYDHSGFLGWSQGWKYLLGMLMFLVSETSRTINVHELKESRQWAVIMDAIPDNSGTWDTVLGRQVLSDDFEHFYEAVRVLNTRTRWPGTPPSCRYRFATSRCGYITRIFSVEGVVDLAHLITLMPAPIDEDAPLGTARTWGSWEWGRCGLPSGMHKGTDKASMQDLKDSWTSDAVFFTSSGQLKDREEGLLILLQWALAYSDFAHMCSLPVEQQP
ncbi:unnamed protein product, partial [Peniophora sp. CBMAI 1063]